MYNFPAKKSITDNDTFEDGSKLCIELILYNQKVRIDLYKNDKTPNIDGYIDLLDSKNTISGKVTVQLKTYPKLNIGKDKYDIPSYLLEYAQKIKTEVVLILVADFDNCKVYWKYINDDYINYCGKKGIQGQYSYHFKKNEILTINNVKETINRWQSLYNEKIATIKDKRTIAFEEIKKAGFAFEQINAQFYNLTNSYIERKEVLELFNWINSEIKEDNSNISLLVGDAGVGKSVVIKQLLKMLNDNQVQTYAIKADIKELSNNIVPNEDNSLDALYQTFSYLISNDGISVLLIDQIDALSQNLSNDRNKLKCYLSFINGFSKTFSKNVRIVISCRIFDLEYDPILNTLKDKNVIKLDKLTEKEVIQTLKLLPNLDNTLIVSPKTIEILRTPQYLDTFCRIYVRNRNRVNYLTPQALYDELWQQTILFIDADYKISQSDIENTLYSIAKKIQKEETLTPNWIATSKDFNIISYLGTNGIVFYNGKTIRFFHQSFYDYSLARYYTTNGSSIAKEIEDKHQGLFLRSTIKLIMSYQREHDESLYKDELETLLFSPKIRFHLKLLTLQMLGSLQDIKTFEKKLIFKLQICNSELFGIFLNQVITTEWFDVLYHPIANQIEGIKDIQNKNDFAIASFVFRFSSQRTTQVFELISRIKDPSVQIFVAERALWDTKDYTSEPVIYWFKQLKQKESRSIDYFLEQAIDSNPEFVCKEVKERMLKSLPCKKNSDYGQNYNEDRFFENICSPIKNKYPLLFYPVLKEGIFNAIKSSRYNYFNQYLDDDSIFNHFNPDTHKHHIIVEWIVSLLTDRINTDHDFVIKEIEDYCNAKETTLFIIAIQVMNSAPNLFTKKVFEILLHADLLEQLLGHGDEEYYFREFLKNCFNCFSKEQKEWYYSFVINYSSKSDSLINNSRSQYHQLVYPYIGVKKRKLIYTIPNEELTCELRKIKGELDRRYKYSCENKQPDHGVHVATICGGLTSMENYVKFSKVVWLNSFLKLKNDSFRRGKFFPIDPNKHAEAFKNCVSRSPDDFISFINLIFENVDIPIIYKTAGLSGLIEGDFPKNKTINLCSKLLDMPFNERDTYSIIEVIIYYCKDESEVLDSIIDYLFKIILEPFETKYDSNIESIIPSTSENVRLLSIGINSVQGNAIQALIEVCSIESRRKQIYEILVRLYPRLQVEHHLSVLYYLYHEEYYDEVLFTKLIQVYLSRPVSEMLLIRPDTINRFWFKNPTIVLPYIKSIIHYKRAQAVLSQILFFGTEYEATKTISNELLSIILNDCSEEVINELIVLSFKNISDTSYKKLCTEILIKYSKDTQKSILSTYAIHCDDLPVEEFTLFNILLNNWLPVLDRENLHSIIRYIKKSSINYPVESYVCLNKISQISLGEYRGEEEEIIELLLAIYKNLKEDDESEGTLESILDTFDKMLYSSTFHLNKVMAKIDRL